MLENVKNGGVKQTMILNTQPKAFVITIPDHPHSQHLSDQCIESGTIFNWSLKKFDAINGYNLLINDWNYYNIRLPENIKGERSKFLKRKGVQGCFLSHYLLWKKSIDINEPIIVLEHDAIITDFWKPIEVSTDVLKLFSISYSSVKDDMFTGTWQVGAQAYIITPKGAAKLIKWIDDNFAYHADTLLGNKIITWQNYNSNLVVLNTNNTSTTNFKRKK
jgi:GR25 family glycosyltransferase involved in LPS biosynthesis